MPKQPRIDILGVLLGVLEQADLALCRVLVASGAVTDRPMSATSTCGATAAAAACQRQAGDQGCLAPTRRSSVRAGRCAQKSPDSRETCNRWAWG